MSISTAAIGRPESKINTGGQGRRPAGPEAGGRAERPAGPAGAGLGNNAKTAATAGQGAFEKRVTARKEKFTARRRLAEFTGLPRVARCGSVSMIEGGEVHLRYGAARQDDSTGCGAAGLGGLVTCGSVWVCPVCSAKISAERAVELSKLIDWNTARGGATGLLTLTMQHHNGHRLRDLRRGLTKAWRHLTGSRSWKQAKRDLGMDGYVRAIEVTHGRNGWHLHIHALLIFDGPVSYELLQLFADEVFERWQTGLSREGFTALREHAVDVRLGDHALDRLGRYINKLAFEAVGGRWKKGRTGGRTPFEILAEGLATGSADDLELWLEWEQGSKGMRQLVWSRGLKARVGVDERQDEEIAAETEHGHTVAVLPARTWRVVRDVVEDLLTATEIGGPAAAYAWLDERRLPFEAYGDDPPDDPGP